MLHIASPADFASLAEKSETCVTIGNFDGLHLGHQTLIRRTLSKAEHENLSAVVVTFWPHPLVVLAGHRAPAQLTSREERLRLFAGLGVAATLEMPFTRSLATLTPEDFVREVLLPLRCRHLVVGYDFSMGRGRAGNVDVLRTLGAHYGFEVEQLCPVIVNDAVVSSTRVRDLVRSGDMWELQAVLGRCHHVAGPVIHGFGRGAGLGFPTANVDTGFTLLPRNGVYACWLSLEGDPTPLSLPSVVNIGVAPTFDNGKVSVEAFVLAGGGDFYGKQARLYFVQRIRDERRFADLEELKARIARDVELARGILATSSGVFCQACAV